MVAHGGLQNQSSRGQGRATGFWGEHQAHSRAVSTSGYPSARRRICWGNQVCFKNPCLLACADVAPLLLRALILFHTSSRRFLHRILPPTVPVRAMMVANLRYRVKKMLESGSIRPLEHKRCECVIVFVCVVVGKCVSVCVDV